MNKDKITFNHEADKASEIIIIPESLKGSKEEVKAQECFAFAVDLTDNAKSPAWVLALVLVIIGKGESLRDTSPEVRDVYNTSTLAEFLFNTYSQEDIDTVGNIFMSEHLRKGDMGLDLDKILDGMPPELKEALDALNPNK